MAGRTYEEVTSGFKPLSLDEIMAIPLAKQAQQDASQLYFDDLQLLEENALSSDKDYVQGQVGALKDEGSMLSQQMMDEGVSRGFMNKVKGLRTRKNREFSASGNTGKANAAYNEFQTNKQNIMNRKDLSDAQKRAGLQKAQDNYVGVEKGGVYEEYVGTAKVDLMEKGRSILSKMTPIERASSLGMSYDEETGIYSRGSYKTKQLEPADIQRVIYHALKNDQSVSDYLREVDSLGIGDSEQMLFTASESAGKVGNVDIYTEEFTPLPKEFQAYGQGTPTGDLREKWNTKILYQGRGLWANEDTFNLDVAGNTAKYFKDGNVIPVMASYDKKYEEALVKKTADFEAVLEGSFMTKKEKDLQRIAFNNNNKSADQIEKDRKKLKETIDKIRESYSTIKGNKPGSGVPESGSPGDRGYAPAVGERPYTDQEIYEIYTQGAQKSEASYTTSIAPINPSSLYYGEQEMIKGTEDAPGSFASANLKIAGFPSGGAEVIAERLSISEDEFTAQVGKTGAFLGFAPGHVDMPGAHAMQFKLKDGSTYILYVEGGGESKKVLQPVSWMNKAIQEVKPFTTYKREFAGGKIRYDHVVTDLNPNTKSFDAYTVRTTGEYTEKEISDMKFEYVEKYNSQVAVDDQGFALVPNVLKRNYDQEMQSATNEITDMYDTNAHGKTSKNLASKN
jgi:hypothetical protein